MKDIYVIIIALIILVIGIYIGKNFLKERKKIGYYPVNSKPCKKGIVSEIRHNNVFIQPDCKGSDELYVNPEKNPDLKDLKEGDTVSFDEQMGKYGPEAINIKPIS